MRRAVSKGWPSRLIQTCVPAGLLLAASCGQDAGQPASQNGGGGGTSGTGVSTGGSGVTGGTAGVAGTGVSTGGAAGTGVSCAAPNLTCNGACINPATDSTNCGACGVVCTAGQACQSGQCATTCQPPQIDCGGMCADTSSNALHCGACNQPCQQGQICQNSMCVTGGCPVGQTLCAGACVDLTTNPLNCGACGTACLTTQTCQSSSCMTTGGTGGMGGGGMTGGTSGASTGGMGGAGMTGGTAGKGGAGAGGTAGAAGGVGQSSTCPNITWPTGNGSKSLGGGMSVSGVYDGGMAVHEGTLNDCSTGDQDSTTPLFEVANGGTVKNVIMGRRVGDGIHCSGSCTIENVWFPNVCDDAITILGSGTVTIRNSGFKNARDKTIQHNGTATVTIDNVYVETAGKLYRSCGEGCSGNARTATLSNIVAIGVDQVAGVSTNDRVTLRNICTYRTFSICSMYEPGSSDEVTTGVNQSNEGPSTNCIFTANDTHSLLSKVSGIAFTTERFCGGPNGYKSGSTATTCVSGFDKCLKPCAPGGYGFKEITCGSNNRYAEGTGAICAMPVDTTARNNLAQSRVMGATAMADNNGECSTEWAIALETSNNANYCVCVRKPGYYEHDNWLSWDCQRRWW